MTKNVRFLKDLTVDCIEVDQLSDSISFRRGDVREVSSVSQVSESFIAITLSNGLLLLDVPRNSVIIL
jgi:hypothetical protein